MTHNQSEKLVRRYLWGPGADQLLVDEAFSNLTGAYISPRWAANDHLGTVGQLLDEQFGIREHREYDSFGAIDEVFTSTGNSVPPPFRKSDVGHAGQLWDDDAELYQNRARRYDPNTGRFLGEDPAQENNNWYAYAGNDPINFRDPTGLSQAGNPLNSLAGGFSSGVVNEVNTLIGRGANAIGQGIGQVSNTLASGFKSVVSTIGSTLGPAFTPARPSQSSTRLLTPSVTTLPPLVQTRATSGVQTAGIGSFQPRQSEFEQRQQQVALQEARRLGLHGPGAQRAADRVFDQQLRQNSFSIGPQLIGQTVQRFEDDILLNTTGLTRQEAAIGLTRTTINTGYQLGVLDRPAFQSDEFFVQQPGFGFFESVVGAASNPLTYAPLGLALNRGRGAVQAADNAIDFSLPILNREFVPDGQRVLQNLTSRENARLIANPRLATTVLTDPELRASIVPGVARLQYGNTVERLVAGKIRADTQLGTLFRHNTSAGPDFSGLGVLEGQFFDVTTAGQVPAHLARPYGATLQPIIYQRPPGFP